MKRDSSVETYRCLLMFAICWLHCCLQGGRLEETRGIYYVMRPAVVGFVYISGWFGINCSILKCCRLIFIGVICALISIELNCLVSGGMMRVVDVLYACMKGYWFLWAYLALMMVSPLLNAALGGDESEVNKRIWPLLALVFGWAFLTHIPFIKCYVPTTAGVTALSFVTMAGVYVVARIIRQRRYDRYFASAWFWCVFVVSSVLCWLGFSHYDSVFALIVAVGVFQIVRKLQLPDIGSRIVLAISPSMFAVYLLHQTIHGFNFVEFGMKTGMTVFDDSSKCCTFVAAVVVFAGCVFLDLLRRLCVAMFTKLFNVCYSVCRRNNDIDSL